MQASRYLRIASVLAQVARATVWRDDPRAAKQSQKLESDLERLGPSFIKLGQTLSSRPDYFSPVYLDALERLQDAVVPFETRDAIRIIEEDLGAAVDSLFSYFSPTPLACASLAQVHVALSLAGEEMAVKVQRPHMKELISQDIGLLKAAARLLDRSRMGRYYDFRRLVFEFEQTIHEELDFTIEAANAQAIAHNLRHFDHIQIPRVIAGLTTSRVLTTERIHGRRVTAEACERYDAGYRSHLAQELVKAYLKQVIEDGLFHADPHMGNILLTDAGSIALIDFGIVGNFDESSREKISKLIFGFARLRSDDVAGVILDLGARTEETNVKAFEQDISELITRYHRMTPGQLGVGKALVDLAVVGVRHHIRLPSGFSLLGKSFLYVDRVCREIDPGLDYMALLNRVSPAMFLWMGQRQFSRENIAQSVFESGRLAVDSAGKFNVLLDKLVNDQIAIRFEHEHLGDLTKTVNRSANRLSFAMVIAALIVGSSLLVRIDIGPDIFGVPILGVGAFLLATLFGVYLLFRILTGERL